MIVKSIKDQLRNLFKIAVTDCLQSLIPILAWYLVGIIYHDSDYFNIFTLTYYFQFVYMSIYNIFIKGSIKYAVKNNHKGMDLGYCAIIEGTAVMFVTVVIASFNVEKLLNYFSVGIKYKPFYVMSLVFLTLDMISCGTAKVMQYQNNDTGAFKLTIKYQLVKCISIIMARLFYFIDKDIFNVNVTVTLTIVLLTIYVTAQTKKYFKITHIYINCLQGWKIEAPGLVGEICMFIIYFFGLQKSVSGSAVFLAAYNMAAMCTDSQWDILSSAIDTNTTKEVCNKSYEKNKKSIYIASIIYANLLLLSSLLMVLIGRTLFEFSLIDSLTIIFIECSTFTIFAIKYVETSWLQIEYAGIWMVITTVIGYVIRIILSMVLTSKYRLSIAVFFIAIYGFICITILYKWKHKN